MIVALVLAAAGVCALPDPAAEPDPASANAYLAVGDGELARGSVETAIVAYREAARLDPSLARARSAYLSTCLLQNRDALIGEGLRRMDARDCPGAIEQFHQLSGDAEAALYQAVCLYEQGDDEEARPLLATAMTAPAFETRAKYFLGLIELRDRSGNDAAQLFDQVAASGESLAERAAVLRSVALRSGRAVVSASLESGYDSNINFTPDGLPASGDFGGAGNLSLSLRPLGLSGPYLRANAFYRRQLQVADGDLGSFSGQVGYRLGRGPTYAFADYAYEATLLGGSPFLLAHRLRAAGQWQVRRFALSLVYAARIGTYQTAGSSAYTGTAHSLTPEVSYRLPLGSSVSLGYSVLRDDTSTANTTSWEHGPRANVRWVLLPTLLFGAEVGLLLRSFDAGTPLPRSDVIGYGSLSLEKELGRFTLFLASGARRSGSNDAAFAYTRLTATFGVSYTFGIF